MPELEKVNLSEKEIAVIKRSIESGFCFQEKAFKDTYEDANDLWIGDHYPDMEQAEEDGCVSDNQVQNIIKVKVETVAFTTPEFTLKARNSASVPKADLAKHALKYWWDEADIQRELKRSTNDKELYGLGVVLTGWDKDEDRPFARRIDPIDFFVYHTATAVVADWVWCFWREWKPLDEVKKDPVYTGASKLKGTTQNTQDYLNKDDRQISEETMPSDVKQVELLHFYRKSDKLYAVFARERLNAPLLAQKWIWQAGRYPFRTIHGKIRPQDFYGTATPIEIKDQQHIMNWGQTMLVNHARQFNRLYQCPEDAIDDHGIETLEGGGGGVVFHNGSSVAPIQPIAHAALQPEVYRSMEAALQSIERKTGLSTYQFADIPSKRLTAVETSVIQNAGGPLFLADAQAFTTLCKEVAEDILAWMIQHSVDDIEIPIYGDDNKVTKWTKFNQEHIKGNYMVEVAVNSTQPPNKQSEIQDAGQVWMGVVELYKLTGGQPLPPHLATAYKELLRAQGVQNPERFIPPTPEQPPPMMPDGMGLPPAPPAPPAAPAEAAGMDPALQQIIDQIPPEVLQQILSTLQPG